MYFVDIHTIRQVKSWRTGQVWSKNNMILFQSAPGNPDTFLFFLTCWELLGAVSTPVSNG